MPKFKSDRLAEDIKRELSVIMRELKDPRITGLLSIVHTEVADDGSHCKVFISSMDGLEAAKASIKGFQSASGFIRRALADRLHLRKCPELKFIPDDSIAHSAHISDLLRGVTDGEKHDGR